MSVSGTRSLSTASSSSSALPSSPPTSGGHTDAGPIAGGVVGGVAALGIVLGAVWMWRHKKRKPLKPPNLEIYSQERYEIAGNHDPGIAEKDGNARVAEADSVARHELRAKTPTQELP